MCEKEQKKKHGPTRLKSRILCSGSPTKNRIPQEANAFAVGTYSLVFLKIFVLLSLFPVHRNFVICETNGPSYSLLLDVFIVFRSCSIRTVGRGRAFGLATLAFEGVTIGHAGAQFSERWGTIAVKAGCKINFADFVGYTPPPSPTSQSKGGIRLPPPSPRPRYPQHRARKEKKGRCACSAWAAGVMAVRWN